MMVGIDAEHVALAGSPQGHFDGTNPIDAIGCDPAERHFCGNRALDHFERDGWLGCKARSLRHMRRFHPRRIVRPGLGQIE